MTSASPGAFTAAASTAAASTASASTAAASTTGNTATTTLLPPLRVPRCLIDPGHLDLPPADAEGLVTVRLRLANGRAGRDTIVAIEPLEPTGETGQAGALPLAITPPVEPHAHLDKIFSSAPKSLAALNQGPSKQGPSNHQAFANRAGTMEGALAANRLEFAERTAELVLLRSEQALQQAWSYGLRAIRSHIDSAGGPAAEASWEALLGQRQRWSDRLTLQLVALVPIQHWLSPAGEELARQVAGWGGVLGGVLGPPFGRSGSDGAAVRALLQLAERHGCPVDLHVDEGNDAPGHGVALVAREALALRSTVPITCSHASSMGLLPPDACERLAERMATAGLKVVAMPRTNLWLLGRRSGHTPWQRPQAPIRPLQRCGVEVAVGGDNVQDPWFPGGDLDPIDLLRLCFTTSHLDPWLRGGLSPFTTSAARVLGLPWDGVLRPGAPADLVVLGASSWGELLARPPQRRVMRGGAWLQPPAAEAPSPLLAQLALNLPT